MPHSVLSAIGYKYVVPTPTTQQPPGKKPRRHFRPKNTFCFYVLHSNVALYITRLRVVESSDMWNRNIPANYFNFNSKFDETGKSRQQRRSRAVWQECALPGSSIRSTHIALGTLFLSDHRPGMSSVLAPDISVFTSHFSGPTGCATLGATGRKIL